MHWFRALVACCKPMKGVDVRDQLLDGKYQACHDACGEEERHQEEVQEEEGLPVIRAQGPACNASQGCQTCLAHGLRHFSSVAAQLMSKSDCSTACSINSNRSRIGVLCCTWSQTQNAARGPHQRRYTLTRSMHTSMLWVKRVRSAIHMSLLVVTRS